MADVALSPHDPGAKPSGSRIDLDRKVHPGGIAAFGLVLLAGLAFVGLSIQLDTRQVGEPLAIGAFLFLGLALVIALGFEFVNGFHDTANAVATVIYTHSLPPLFAVIWSGCFNFLGVVASSGAVAYSVITLLPVDLILQVGSAGGYAMIFALLIAAVVWNLGTWWLGLPNSSSHALIGSILGVGLANQLMAQGPDGTSGVEWGQGARRAAGASRQPAVGLHRLLRAPGRDEAHDPQREAVQGAGGQEAPAAVHPRPARVHLHGGVLRARRQRRPERAWG